MFKTGFKPYVCEGDSIECEIDGIMFTARLAADTDSRPEDSECYTKKHIEAWRNGDWSYFGVVLSAEKDGVDLGDHLASLWGIEGNFPSRRKNPNTYFLEVANDLLPDAIDAAKKEATRIADAFNDKINAQRAALEKALAFIEGFEGDEMQEGVDSLLSEIRGALA